MRVIGFLSDFGLRDPYVAQTKMSIYRINPDARIVDLTHMIKPFCISCASYILYSSIDWFPESTIFLVVVDPGVGGPRRPLILSYDTMFFVGPDNGVFWPIVEKLGEERFSAYTIRQDRLGVPVISSTFHGRDIFAPAAAFLSLGRNPLDIGDPVDLGSLRKLRLLDKMRRDGSPCYRIVYVDRFGNMALSARGMDALSELGSTVIVERLRDGYREKAVVTSSFSLVEPGETALYINSFGFLELSMYMGNLYKSHAYRVGDWVCLKSPS